jgi:hypothetical protein
MGEGGNLAAAFGGAGRAFASSRPAVALQLALEAAEAPGSPARSDAPQAAAASVGPTTVSAKLLRLECAVPSVEGEPAPPVSSAFPTAVDAPPLSAGASGKTMAPPFPMAAMLPPSRPTPPRAATPVLAPARRPPPPALPATVLSKLAAGVTRPASAPPSAAKASAPPVTRTAPTSPLVPLVASPGARGSQPSAALHPTQPAPSTYATVSPVTTVATASAAAEVTGASTPKPHPASTHQPAADAPHTAAAAVADGDMDMHRGRAADALPTADVAVDVDWDAVIGALAMQLDGLDREGDELALAVEAQVAAGAATLARAHVELADALVEALTTSHAGPGWTRMFAAGPNPLTCGGEWAGAADAHGVLARMAAPSPDMAGGWVPRVPALAVGN